MKILITGASGMLGTDLVSVLKSVNHRLITDRVDITNYDKFHNFTKKTKPDLIIHTAAYTDVDGAEKEIGKCFSINTHAIVTIVSICKELNIPLIFISTDYVFSGNQNTPYSEFAQPQPLSVYGMSKYLAEVNILALLNEYCIIRTAGLYGKSKKNFVKTVLESNEPLKLPIDQITSTTYTVDLAHAIKELIEYGSFGKSIYHFTNSDIVSWYDFAQKILEISGKRKELIACKYKDINRPAKRPKFSALDNNSDIQLGHYTDALGRYIHG